MAEYYALLNRAVGALPRNDEASRREIYVKARSALIKQLKAIDPPLPAAEISKQRLALEDAIRRVEREALEAVAATALSEEEISRRAESALQAALGGGPVTAATADAPAEEAPRETVYAERVKEPEPAFEGAGANASQDDDNASYAEVVAPSVQPRSTPRSQPAQSAPFERAPFVTDVETAPPPPPRQPPRAERAAPSRGRSGGRGWEQPPRSRERRSVAGRLTLLVLIVLVLGAMAYYLITNWDDVEDLTDSLLGNEPEAADDAGDPAAEGAVDGVIEGVDPAAGEPAIVEEPAVFVEPSAVFYVEPNGADGPAARYDATIEWELLSNSTGPVIAADITVPDRGLTIMLRIGQSPDPNFSHEVIVQANVAAGAEGGALASVENLAVKSSEEGIGVALDGDPEAEPEFFFIELPVDSQRQNTTRLTISPWFDLSFVYESGDQAILSFSKGSPGGEVFEEAFAAWDAEG